MRVLSTYGSRGDVEPMVGPAVRLRAPGPSLRAEYLVGRELAEEPEWGLRRDALGIHFLSRMADGVR